MTQPSIAEAISGVSGSVTLAMRYEIRDVRNGFVADISHAVSGGKYDVDIFRDVPSRISGLAIDANRLEAPINFQRHFLAPFVQMGLGSSTVEWQLGLFVMGRPVSFRGSNFHVHHVDAGDMCERLARARLSHSYRARLNQNIFNSAAFLCNDLGLRLTMEGAEQATADDYSWSPGTSYLEVVNKLSDMAGCYPVWADRDGVIHTRRVDIQVRTDEERTFVAGPPGMTTFFGDALTPNATVSWIGPDALATYRTDREPRLLREPASGFIDPEDRPNVAISEGLGGLHVVVGNADSRSHLYRRTLHDLHVERPIDLQLAAQTNVLLDHAGWQLVLAEALTESYEIETAIDPRIEGRPYYRVTIPGVSDNEFWISMSRSFSLDLRGHMNHRIGKIIPDLRMAAYIVTEYSTGEDFVDD